MSQSVPKDAADIAEKVKGLYNAVDDLYTITTKIPLCDPNDMKNNTTVAPISTGSYISPTSGSIPNANIASSIWTTQPINISSYGLAGQRAKVVGFNPYTKEVLMVINGKKYAVTISFNNITPYNAITETPIFAPVVENTREVFPLNEIWEKS